MLVDKITYKNRKCIVNYIWSEKVKDGLQDKLHNPYKKKVSSKFHKSRTKIDTRRREALILWLLQEAQGQTPDAALPEEFANAEVKFYTGGLLQHEYKKAGDYYYVNLISSLHHIINFYSFILTANQSSSLNHSANSQLYTICSFLWKRRLNVIEHSFLYQSVDSFLDVSAMCISSSSQARKQVQLLGRSGSWYKLAAPQWVQKKFLSRSAEPWSALFLDHIHRCK